MTIPQQKITITHGGVDYSFEELSLQFEVVQRENAAASLILIASDYQSANFLDKCDVSDNVKVEFRYYDETTSYTQLFGGWITNIQPSLGIEGELLRVEALDYGVALVNMLVKQQYGTQSEHPDITTLLDVLTHSSYGIIPKYVRKAMAGTDSGYTNINTTKIAGITSNFSYLHFCGKPASKCLDDMIDLVLAANGQGAHWLTIADGTTAYLCVATVPDGTTYFHENPPADVWPTFWNLTEPNSIIEVKRDMIKSNFEKQRSEANYVMGFGNFRRPANIDGWTENNAGSWGYASSDGNGVCENEDSIYKIGVHSIRGRIPNNAEWLVFYYPSACNLNLNLSKIGTKINIPKIGFYIRRNANVYVGGGGPVDIRVYLGTGPYADARAFYYEFYQKVPSANQWYHMSFPIGEYSRLDESVDWEWQKTGSPDPDWNDIDYIRFEFSASAADARLYIDGLNFEGMIVRAAYDSSKYSSQRCKMMFIRDDVPKDDTLVADLDSGQLAQLIKAELFRAVTTPIIGQISLPLKPTMKPGQLAHIHFGQKADTTVRINKNMRILEHRPYFTRDGAQSQIWLTDDLKNSQPRQPVNAYNSILKAVAPGFQDRARASLITGDLDSMQEILEKSYST